MMLRFQGGETLSALAGCSEGAGFQALLVLPGGSLEERGAWRAVEELLNSPLCRDLNSPHIFILVMF